MAEYTNAFSVVVENIFGKADHATRAASEARFPEAAAEADAVLRAQSGDQDAVVDLLYAYGPALRKTAGIAARTSNEPLSEEAVEDLRQELVVEFLAAIRAFDPAKGHKRLAAVVPQHMKRALAEQSAQASAFSVPERTRSRVFAILREAGQDVDAAMDLVRRGGQDMSVESFASALVALRNVGSLDETPTDNSYRAQGGGIAEEDGWATADVRSIFGGNADGYVEVEDRILCEVALDACDPEEALILGYAYGFADYEPLKDAAIAERIGSSRSSVRRRHLSGLDKAREALGVA